MKKTITFYEFVKKVSKLKHPKAINTLCNRVNWYSIYYKEEISKSLILKVYKLSKQGKMHRVG